MEQNWHRVPARDKDALRQCLDELATLGWPRSHWGMGIGPDFHVEAFGGKGGMIGAKGKSILEAAEKTVAYARKRNACECSDYRYDYHNGFKSCASCHALVRCTLAEAMANYEYGTCEADGKSYQFDRRKPLCDCGSPLLVRDPVYHIYRCPCGQRLQPVYDGVRPARDNNGDQVIRTLANDPIVLGYWLPEERRWLPELGKDYPDTIEAERLPSLSPFVGGTLRRTGAELRVYGPGGVPGDVIPFKWGQPEERHFQMELAAVLLNLANRTHGDPGSGADENCG